MAQAVLRHILLGLATSGLLMGCVQGGDTATPAAPGTSGTARATATGDVEAPEVFQATDSALWDGRPSLGGIWVASADVKDPERVVMFNPANGKTVQGALFRRERDNPGPRLQISSDAAEALGILAGQPVEIRVTALRRIEAVAAAEVATPAAEAAATGAGTAAAPATDAEPEGTAGESDAAATAAAATAALAATGAAVPGAAVADGAVAAVDAAAPDATVTEPPKRKTWKERRAEAKAAREAKKAAAAAAAAGEVADGATGPAAAEVPATANAVTGATIESAPLDARSADAAAAPATDAAAAPEVAAEPVVVAPPKTRRQLRAEEAAAKAAAATAATEAPAEAPAAAAPAGRLIQVASFAKEANANRAVEALAKAGITGQTRKSEANGKIVWGVVTTGDEAQLTAIKGFGFADAFFLQ